MHLQASVSSQMHHHGTLQLPHLLANRVIYGIGNQVAGVLRSAGTNILKIPVIIDYQYADQKP